MAKILVVGLNPAWQHILSLPAIKTGEVNRAQESWSLASGKGLNAAKVLARLGHEVSVLQILAGENGRRCQEACAKWKVRSLHVRTRGETRECTTLLSGEDHSATEFIEPFSAGPELAEQLLARVESNISYDAILFCGSAPRGIPDSIYGEILKRINPAPILWDSVVGLTPEVLKAVTWVKVNEKEFERLSVLTMSSWPKVLITSGAKPARVLHSKNSGGSYALPALKEIKSPIGSGDTVTAVLVDGLLRGMDEEATVRRALAAGMASCLTPLPAEYDPAEVSVFESRIRREM